MPSQKRSDPWEQPQHIVERDGGLRRPTVEELKEIELPDQMDYMPASSP